MAKQAWKVRLFEARTQDAFRATQTAADFVEVFGVHADGSDAAKRDAKAWLESRGHTVRAISVSAKDERTLVAYVMAGSVQAAKEKAAGAAKRAS